MTTSDIALLDSNVLIYAYQSLSEFHRSAKALRDKGMDGEIQLCVCPQVLMEFYAVITNPKRVTNPIEPREAMNEVEKYFQAEKIMKIHPKEDLLLRIIALARKYEVKRYEIFDLQIAATILSNGINRIYTYNQGHFAKFTELEVLVP
jgi:hypothetical protein